MSSAKAPHRLAIVHFSLAAVWALLTIPTVVWWRESILWVAFMSIYAIVIAHLSAAGAARAEQEAEDQ
ncbi:hypothetical protein [Streptomyces flaveolus]|uniref:hypothetical protein n=1 Tax=Streptomyces flaveolus TaxID=67297 RepID=UPI0033DAE28C